MTGVMYPEDKPSLEELFHFGVKGMRWGVRKKVTTSDIKSARARQRGRSESARKTSSDRAISSRLTRGEKVAALLIGGPVGLVVIGGAAINAKRIERNVRK